MRRTCRFISISIVLLYCTAIARQHPSTDIWLVPLSTTEDSLQAGTPINITSRAEYDNQPSFLTDGTGLLYTSIQTNPPGPHEPAQTDILRYDIATKLTTRITITPESEYSPTLMPGGRAFSVVRVEQDSTQRLWQFGLDGQRPSVILPNIKAVGYHAWIDANMVALFVIGNPLTLQVANVGTGISDTVAVNIGRSIHKVPDRDSISYVHKVSENEWWIKEIGIHTRNESNIIQTLERTEDYAWTPNDFVVMAQDSKLLMYKTGRAAKWMEFADFSSYNIKGITRIAISPKGDWLAFVATE
ncbi:MAG: hypothetical protein L0Y80_03775 [Ignavibacteriae bacterium]|nr:hypothetical protein [Ignavibacteriota bacterium]